MTYDKLNVVMLGLMHAVPYVDQTTYSWIPRSSFSKKLERYFPNAIIEGHILDVILSRSSKTPALCDPVIETNAMLR